MSVWMVDFIGKSGQNKDRLLDRVCIYTLPLKVRERLYIQPLAMRERLYMQSATARDCLENLSL